MQVNGSQSPRNTSASAREKPKASPTTVRKFSLVREESRKASPESTPRASLPPGIKAISAQDIYDSVLEGKSVDFSIEKLGRKISEQDVMNLGTALEVLKATENIHLFTDFHISGQELGDANVHRLVSKLPIAQMETLDLSNNKLTAGFRKTLRSISEQSKGNFRYVYLEHNDFGTGELSDVNLLAENLIDLYKNNTSLTIEATDNNFPQDLVQKLEGQKKIDADGALGGFIFASNGSSNQIQPSPKKVHPPQNKFITEEILGTPVSLVDKDSEVWRIALEKCLDQPVLTGKDRIFSCGFIPSDQSKRQALIELLCSDVQNPGDDEELTLEFATEDGTVRLNRTMASSPEVANIFVQAACILQD